MEAIQALADDHIMFFTPNWENISKTRDMWEVFSNASRLRINMQICSHFMYRTISVRVGVARKDMHHGIICGHLEYLTRVEILYVKHTERGYKKLEEKFMYQMSKLWNFHV